MNNIQQNHNTILIEGRTWINGKELPPVPTKCKNSSITVINDRIYIDGYEFKKGKWRRTLRALWHLWF